MAEARALKFCLVIILGGPCNMVDFTWSSVAQSIGISRCTCKNRL